jgi:hypothetical protein
VAPDDDDAMGDGSGSTTDPSSDREPLDYDAKRQASMDPVGARSTASVLIGRILYF